MDPQDEGLTGQIIIPTTTTTQRPTIPLKDPAAGIGNIITTTSTTILSVTTTTTSSTTTTATIRMSPGKYSTNGQSAYYLRSIIQQAGQNQYVIDYNTTDGVWVRATTSDKIFNDQLILEITGHQENPLTVEARITPNEALIKSAPEKAQIIQLGKELNDRNISGLRITNDTLLGDRIKLSLYHAGDIKNLDLQEGDLTYYMGREIGVMETRVPGNLAHLYVLDDQEIYREHRGERYCMPTETRTFHNAQSIIVNGIQDTTHDDMRMRIISQKAGAVTIRFSKGDFQADFELTCATTLNIFRKKVNLIWYGNLNGKSAKLTVQD
jgi:hypothetical protein